jgi:trigger factor
MSELLRGKALALLLENATITDASGRPVDLDELTEQFQPPAADTPAETGAEAETPDETDEAAE